MEVKKVAEEQEIWNKEEEVEKSEEEAKKLVPQKFHKQIYIFGKKVSEIMPIKKMWDYIIKVNEGEDVFIVKREKRRGM